MSPYLLNFHRRRLLGAGGGALLAIALPSWAKAAAEIEIAMSGTPTGSEVWFKPRGVLIQQGQTVRWINKDLANVHTVTAYHPDNGKPQRIPIGALSWNSGYLMPGESFSLAFTQPGVYDFFCIPHEQAGMVGRIIVEKTSDQAPYLESDSLLPLQAQAVMPKVEAILKHISVD